MCCVLYSGKPRSLLSVMIIQVKNNNKKKNPPKYSNNLINGLIQMIHFSR